MACGCADVCNCFLEDSDTVAVSGIGTAGSPYVMTVINDPNGGLVNSAAGVGILIDPASQAPVSVGPAGLLVDCCPAAVVDSDTIDFSTPGGAVSGDVILDPDLANILTASPAGVLADIITQDTLSVAWSGEGTIADPLQATVVTGGGGGVAAFSTGMMMDFGLSAANIPGGWLACDGSAVTVGSGNIALRNALLADGSPYGVTGADPNVPDTRGRNTTGLGTHADVNALGDNDGLAVGSRTPVHLHADGTLATNAVGTGVTVNGAGTGLTVNSIGPGYLSDNEDTSQTGLAAGMTVTEVTNCLRDAINADADCSGATPRQISVAAGGGILNGAADPSNHHKHDISHGHGVTDPGHTHGVTDPGHSHDVTGSTATTAVPFVIVNKIIKT